MSSDDKRGGADRRGEALCGLAGYHLRASRLDEARRALDLASASGSSFRQELASARLAILEGRAEDAVAALKAARERDPFDEEACDLLGELLRARGDLEEALGAWAHARALCGHVDEELALRHDERIDETLRELGRDSSERAALVESAAHEVSALASRLSGEGDQGGGEASALRKAADLLRGAGLFEGLEDDDLELLEGAIARESACDGEAVFREGQPSEDIYVVEAGRVRIQRETPFGTQALATVSRGSVFGEMNFIDGRSRSADALADGDVSLIRVSHSALHEVFEAEPRLALAFLREFWRGLADKVREANEMMKTFFEEAGSAPRAPAAQTDEPAETGRDARVDESTKTDVLEEQGLTGDDLRRLAAFAEAKSYEVEAPIFREGAEGDALYVVVSGQVRISKDIPGVGEEALAILERGAFFGEMALLDGGIRSATAKAHASGTTVLRIARRQLDELLQSSTGSAIELLSILCRILSSRLREINDKIVQWRMMSGGF